MVISVLQMELAMSKMAGRSLMTISLRMPWTEDLKVLEHVALGDGLGCRNVKS